MAINLIRNIFPARLEVACSHPASPLTGQPVRYGALTGVALTDEGEGQNDSTDTTVDFGMNVWDLSTKAEDDSGNSAITAGDQLYYVDADINDGTGTLSKKSSGYFYGIALESITSGQTDTINVLSIPGIGPGKADILAGAVGTEELATDALAASAAGRLKMATDYFDSTHLLKVFEANSFTEAVLDDLLAANAIDGADRLKDDSLDGNTVANVADANTAPGIVVFHRINTAGGVTADTDVTVDDKIRVLDVWVRNNAAGTASDTIQVKNGANAITDAIDISGADNTIARASTIDDAQHEIAAGGTLRVTETDGAGSDSPATTVNVLCVKVA